MRLENKNAIITGATGGIGFATVSKYLDEGANVMTVSYTHLTLPTNREV